ncbi:RNA methyltransferase [Candidatus Babeliales bacterium]|nr:RNA methyltransferase [Candidatus Babeliales bacterium]MBP9843341.1 RNA methyltransferase [Candidatus Babeliales bacterium]
MNYISSTSNEQVKHIVNLQDKAYRYEHRQFLVEGTRACTQLLEKYEPVAIYMTDHYYRNHELSTYDDLVIGVSDHVMDKICNTKNPSGICAIFTIPETLPLPQTGPGLVLVEVSDPGNMGTLIRTAAAMNINKIIIIGGVDPYNPKVIQSTAGCLTNIQIYQTSWQQLKAQKNLELCALVVQNGKQPDELNLQNKYIVVGNEAHGLSNEQTLDCQEKMSIPMPGNAESLNAAIAGAIGLYVMSKHN